jgi:outer membrane immunogenic protein
MKKHAALVALTLAFSAGAAVAADLSYPSVAPGYVPTPAAINWTGFYGGLNIGGGWSSSVVNPNTRSPYTDLGAPGSLFLLPGSSQTGGSSGGVVGGAQLGYNYQFGRSFVIGLEADFQGTTISSNSSNGAATYVSPLGTGNLLIPLATPANIGVSLDWFGTVRGRAGYLFTPTLLLYGTGGFAYGALSGNVSGNNNVSTGWTGGGGVEWMFVPHWTAKLEYLYVDLDSSGVNGAFTGYQLGSHNHAEINVVRAGVNYLFNFGGAPAPVLAKY